MLRPRIAARLLAGAALCGVAAPALAQAQDESRTRALEARLDAMEREIANLRAELAAARAAAPTPPASAPPAAPAPPPPPGLDERVTALEKQPGLGFRVGGTRFSLGGYLKLDAFASSFTGGDPAANVLINDYYTPGQIPVGGASEGVNLTTSVRETRIVLKSETPLAGETLAGLLEVDFLDTPQLGNQRVSNSFVPRLRRAFITWKDFTFGQDWSTFQNAAALPERLDFIGPTEGSVFERQPLVRWQKGNFSIAVENPETTISVGAASFEADDDAAPDVVLRYDRKLPHGSIALAGIARLLKVDNLIATGVAGAPVIDGEAFGWGISASGVHDFGANRVTWMASGGQGIGRYLGLNLRDDVVATPQGDIDAPFVYSGFVSLRHRFSPQWRLIGTGSAYHAETPDFASQALTDTVWSGNLDLIYNPAPPLSLGIGFRYASREIASGEEGSLRRVQLSAKYDY